MKFRPVGYVFSTPLGVSADLQSVVKKCPNLFVLRGFEIPVLRGRTRITYPAGRLSKEILVKNIKHSVVQTKYVNLFY